jgi:hypothetical protein
MLDVCRANIRSQAAVGPGAGRHARQMSLCAKFSASATQKSTTWYIAFAKEFLVGLAMVSPLSCQYWRVIILQQVGAKQRHLFVLVE